MNRALLAEWRRRVRPGDPIICLGDVAHFDAWHDDSRLRLDVAGCPGERPLILGNHHVYSRAELAAAGFDQQYAAAVCDTDPLLLLTHVPLRRVPPNTVNIHGHLHGGRGPTGRQPRQQHRRVPAVLDDDIIASKQAANRAKDRQTLPRLRAFREYLREQGRHHPRLPELMPRRPESR